MSRIVSLALFLLAAPAAAHADALPRGALPVIRVQGHSYVTLRASPEDTWGRGQARLVRRISPTVAVRNVRLSALPRDVREDARGTVRVFGPRGEVCRARMARPVLLRQAIPDMRYDDWEGESGVAPPADREVAAELWSMDVESRLVARLIPSRGRCRDGAWASRGRLTFGQTSADVPNEVLTAFRSLEEHGWLAEVWPEIREEEGETAEHWDARPGSGRTATSLRVGGRAFWLVGASGFDGCGDFAGGAWGLFELTDEGPVLLTHGGRVDPPRALADLDGDGVPEAIGYQRAWFSSTGETVDVSAPFFGCPC